MQQERGKSIGSEACKAGSTQQQRDGFPLAVAVTLCLVMVFSGISEYFRLMIIAQGVRDALQDAVISTVSDNYDDVYSRCS